MFVSGVVGVSGTVLLSLDDPLSPVVELSVPPPFDDEPLLSLDELEPPLSDDEELPLLSLDELEPPLSDDDELPPLSTVVPSSVDEEPLPLSLDHEPPL